MRIALVGAEFEENLAVRYLRGALESDGQEVVQLVFNAQEDTGTVARALVESNASIAGFSMVFTHRAREFAALAHTARELGYAGHIIAGGHFAAFHAEQLLQDYCAFDSIALGEGEEILRSLANSLDSPGAVAGLVWRRGSEIVRNPPAVKPQDLDQLAWPTRKYPPDDYLGLPIANVLSSRGCLHTCAFCSIAAWHRLCGGARLRLRSPAAVAEEMAELYRRGYRIFNFHDDNFLVPKLPEAEARTRDLRQELEARGVGRIAFAIKSRPDSVQEPLFERLRALGLFRVFLGVEAGTADSLRNLGRGHNLHHNARALEIVNKLDLHTCFNLLLFNPDSTLEDVATNVEFLRSHPFNPMNFCRTEVYAGTPLEHRLREQGRLQGDYWGYDYVIADPRAETAFEIAYPVFKERNYGEHGLHHLAMHIDYEHQLLQHFFRSPRGLRRRVKEHIVATNLNTCQHLSRILERAAAQFPDPSSRAAFAAEMTAQVAEDDARLYAIGQGLLREIHSAAYAARTKPWARRAAAAGLVAASMTLAAGCKRSHPKETAPMPTEQGPEGPPEGTHMTEMVAPPSPRDAAPEAEQGDAQVLRALLSSNQVRYLANRVNPGDELEIDLTFDRSGKVKQASVRRATISQQTERTLIRHLQGLVFQEPAVIGKHFIVVFSADELAKARLPSPSHVKEMVAHPPPTPSTQYNERAPSSNRDKK